MINSIEETTKADQKIASESIDELKRTIGKVDKSRKKSISLKVVGTNETISIPKTAMVLLSKIVEEMSNGKTLNLVSMDDELTTQEAANILKVSRPHLVKLLESGKIAFKKVGTHRRVKISDIIKYEKSLRKARRSKLNALTLQGQKLKMGYDS